VQTNPTPDTDRQFLIAWLRGRDAHCPICGYNLRDQPDPSCPECGGPLRLELGSERLRIGPWLLGVFSLAAACGFDGVAAVLLTMGLIIEPPPPGVRGVVLVVLGLFLALALVCGLGIMALTQRRRAWARAMPAVQWRRAGTIFAATLVAHAAFGVIVLHRL
jgi:hypothetical protein